MSRWVCIDGICIPSDENDWYELVNFADAIAEQDPVDIICCRECMYADEEPIANGRYWCAIHQCFMHFCSSGKRGRNR